jgi:Ca-activated chloride channel family protein
VFRFGIGSSVNRFLLDGMARAGRGEAEYVLRHEDAQAAADRFYERINTPVLTDVALDWGTLPVEAIVPARVPDLFAARPIIVLGRYRHGAEGVITLRGRRAGIPFSRAMRVALPDVERAHDAVAQLWAREQVESLTAEDWEGAQRGAMRDDLRKGIERLGLGYRLVTAYTAFVAVEDRVIVEGGQRRTIQVPVEMPQNVSVEGVFGEQARVGGKHAATSAAGVAYRAAPGGVAGGVVGGVVGGLPNAPPPPPAAPDQVDRDAPDRPAAAASPGLDVALARMVQCFDNARASGGDPSTCGAGSDGRVRVRVLLAVTPGAQLLKRLEDAGLQVTPSAARRGAMELEGTVPVDRLRALADMKEVRFIALQKL